MKYLIDKHSSDPPPLPTLPTSMAPNPTKTTLDNMKLAPGNKEVIIDILDEVPE